MLNVLLVSTSSLKRFPVCLAVVASCLRLWFVSLLCISVCVYMCVYVYCVYYVGVLVVPSFVVVYVLGIVELERALAVKGVAGMSCETRALGMGRDNCHEAK